MESFYFINTKVFFMEPFSLKNLDIFSKKFLNLHKNTDFCGKI